MPGSRRISQGDALSDPFLARHLAGVELGSWAVDAETIHYIREVVRRRQPKAILEFGSGVSTLCFAHFMRAIEPPGPVVFFIEQDPAQMRATFRRLEQAQLDHLVRGLHVPMREDPSGRGPWLDIGPAEIEHLLGPSRPDFVFVDGPSGPPGVRGGTLPAAVDLLAPLATVLMDDGLRPGELRIAREWNRFDAVSVRGVRIIGKGIIELTISREG